MPSSTCTCAASFSSSESVDSVGSIVGVGDGVAVGLKTVFCGLTGAAFILVVWLFSVTRYPELATTPTTKNPIIDINILSVVLGEEGTLTGVCGGGTTPAFCAGGGTGAGGTCIAGTSVCGGGITEDVLGIDDTG